MSDEAIPSTARHDGRSSPAGLDDLERRLASFESATKRLSRTVGEAEVAAKPAAAPRPGTRRFSDHQPIAPQDEISGMRPAVQAPQPQTGALTARSRQGGGATPGFTSAFGKPAIALVPAPAAPAAPAVASVATTSRRGRAPPPQHRVRWIALGAGAAIVLFLLMLPRAFTSLGSAAVWADEQRVTATAAGPVDSVPVSVGTQIDAGQVLARIGGAEITAPHAGTVSRLLVSPGVRIAVGEPVAFIAAPASVRIVAALPDGIEAAIGHRVRITLLGEGRSIDGAVEQVLAAGAPGPWNGGGQPPARLVIQPDPSPKQVQLGQGAKVILLGAPTAGRQLLFALRQVLPW